MKAQVQDPEAPICDACRTIPISYLSLDIDEPMSGWPAFFRERDIEVAPDDLGRPSVPRQVLGELLNEREEQEARLAAQRAEQAAARKVPVSVGVPALDGASAFESLVAAGGVVTPQQEFGGGRTPVFQDLLDERFAETRRQEAHARAEQEAVKRAQAVLEGRDEKMTPEEIILEALARQGVRLLPGSRWPVRLEAAVLDAYGRSDEGPHLVGRLDAEGRRQFDVRVTPKTRAGRDARELLREELLDVIFDDGAVRLVP